MATPPQPPPGSVLDFLLNEPRYVPIFERIVHHLSPVDLVRFRRVNRALNAAVSTALRTQWSIDKALAHYFKDPEAFRNVLGQVSGVLSGGFALRFFDRLSNEEGEVWCRDLDVFVWGKQPETELLTEYVRKEGHVSPQTITEEPTTVSAYPSSPLSQLRDTSTPQVERYELPTSDHAINIIFTPSPPIITVLVLKGLFPLTAFANIITSTKAYAPFAKWTFKAHRSYLLGPDSGGSNITPSLAICAATGREVHDVEIASQKRPQPHLGIRSLGDGQTWCIPLTTEGVTPPQLPDFVVDGTSFMIRARESGLFGRFGGAANQHTDFYDVKVKEVEHVALEHPWIGLQEVKKRVHSALVLQLMAMPKETRPVDLEKFGVDSVMAQPKAFEPLSWLDGLVLEWVEEMTG
ncbi:uncharacterized protein BDZ99DRAFT_24438 [Mytilinidion resinicola]|uniref:F-box domain-containing protein n=1 Tax=Mytilinidion resinicola TaxID=574789 RepID=A0A6A6ZAW2_9PEZI|nr:uncharacterized protein BDZ99DRAFT_24438 [Mytilinidion resinicola]KAF2817843.1 hypothetical protein BDZ99DRAFT_24438 [Mytilinidion resinicola]